MDRLLGRPAGIERASERFMVISFMCPNLGVQLTRPVALTHSLTHSLFYGVVFRRRRRAKSGHGSGWQPDQQLNYSMLRVCDFYPPGDSFLARPEPTDSRGRTFAPFPGRNAMPTFVSPSVRSQESGTSWRDISRTARGANTIFLFLFSG